MTTRIVIENSPDSKHDISVESVHTYVLKPGDKQETYVWYTQPIVIKEIQPHVKAV